MIHGTVDGLQAKVNIIIRLGEQVDVEFKCVIDTGFEGALTLPPAIVSKLGLPYLSEINANLADNSNTITKVHLATIFWMGIERNIPVLAMGRRPLIGTALLENYHLSIDFCDGGSVIVDEII